jgi:hypothetical protein
MGFPGEKLHGKNLELNLTFKAFMIASFLHRQHRSPLKKSLLTAQNVSVRLSVVSRQLQGSSKPLAYGAGTYRP